MEFSSQYIRDYDNLGVDVGVIKGPQLYETKYNEIIWLEINVHNRHNI